MIMKTIGIASTQAQNELVQVIDGTPKVSHIRIAENTSNEVGTIKRLIDNYKQEIKEFGQLGFKIHTERNSVGAINKRKEYFLSEDQATFLMTLLRNNKVVVNFKKNLVKAFIKLKGEYKNKLDRKHPYECLSEAIDLAIQAGLGFQEKRDLLTLQEQEIKELKANNNKYKSLQSNIASLGTVEVLMSIEEAGVELGIWRNTLFQMMRNKKFLKLDNSPYKKYDGMYFVQKMVKVRKGKNKTQYLQTFVLPKGLELLKQTFS